MNETHGASTKSTAGRITETIFEVSDDIARNYKHGGHLAGMVGEILEGGVVLTAEERRELAGSLYEGGCEHPLALLPEAKFAFDGELLTFGESKREPGSSPAQGESTIEAIEERLLKLGDDIVRNTAYSQHIVNAVDDIWNLLEGGLVVTRGERDELAHQLRLGGCEHAQDLLREASFNYDEYGRAQQSGERSEAPARPRTFPACIDLGAVADEKRSSRTDRRDTAGMPPINQWLSEHMPNDFSRRFGVNEFGMVNDRETHRQLAVYQETKVGGRAVWEARAVSASMPGWEPGPSPHDGMLGYSSPTAERRDIAPDPCAQPEMRAFAERQKLDYVEGWPVLTLKLSLGQPEEQLACHAMIVSPRGIMLVRQAHDDEREASIHARGESEIRNLRIESAVKELLPKDIVERNDGHAMPVHILTVGTQDQFRPMIQAGTNVRCKTCDTETMASWYRDLVNDEKMRYSYEDTSRAWDAMMPKLANALQKGRCEEVIASAIGAGPHHDPRAESELAGEARALRGVIQSARPADGIGASSPFPEVGAKEARIVGKAEARALETLGVQGADAQSSKSQGKGRER